MAFTAEWALTLGKAIYLHQYKHTSTKLMAHVHGEINDYPCHADLSPVTSSF